MTQRPTTGWRTDVAAEAAKVAAGTLAPDQAYAAGFFPEELLAQTDEVCDRFEADVADLVNHRWEPATDNEIFEVIKRTVEALNAVNIRWEYRAYETAEREKLCLYIETSLDEAGIDVDAFAARHGLTRYEITDEWREW